MLALFMRLLSMVGAGVDNLPLHHRRLQIDDYGSFVIA
jgi:hypothetical protein